MLVTQVHVTFYGLMTVAVLPQRCTGHTFLGMAPKTPGVPPCICGDSNLGVQMELRTIKQRAYVPTAGTLEPYAAPIMILVVEMAAVHHYTLST